MIWLRHRLDCDWAAGIKRDAGTDGRYAAGAGAVSEQSTPSRAGPSLFHLILSHLLSSRNQPKAYRFGVEDPSINHLQSQSLIQKNT